ncbi:hypothetical protein ACHAXS_005131 [Conticribra weissflogii]
MDSVGQRPESCYVHDRYLDSEERYQIFVVKAAERPHLLHWKPSPYLNDLQHNDGANIGGNFQDEKKIDVIEHSNEQNRCSNNDPTPPLTDGCDLPGWRCQQISPCANNDPVKFQSKLENFDWFLGGSLNVGAGSTLFRRESQFPFISSDFAVATKHHKMIEHNKNCWWYDAKERFLLPPPSRRAAPVVDHADAATIIDLPSEFETIDSAKLKSKRKVTKFAMEYEVKNRPVKILGATQGWSAMPNFTHKAKASKPNATYKSRGTSWADVGGDSELLSAGGKGGWTFANLVSRFGNVSFRFSDQHGEMMPLSTYSKYITSPEGLSDDSPLGIYDSEFGDDLPTNVLLQEYSIPSCFSPDLFDLTDDSSNFVEPCTVDSGIIESNTENSIDSDNGNASISKQSNASRENEKLPRPPYRWVLIGPERSGTGMHVDPLWTNAWVTVLQGLKRWLLFPPSTTYELIGMFEGKPQIPSSIWFRDYYDKVTAKSWPREFQPVEVLQYPGETVFVPAGWPHLVLNLELTVAVTHNYASEFGPFQKVWNEVARDEEDFGRRWYSGLKKCGRGDLASMAPLEMK